MYSLCSCARLAAAADCGVLYCCAIPPPPPPQSIAVSSAAVYAVDSVTCHEFHSSPRFNTTTNIHSNNYAVFSAFVRWTIFTTRCRHVSDILLFITRRWLRIHYFIIIIISKISFQMIEVKSVKYCVFVLIKFSYTNTIL